MDDGLVDGGLELPSVEVGVELGPLDDGVLPPADAGDVLLDPVVGDVGEESHPAVVDAHYGGVRRHGGPEDGPVPADGDDDVRLDLGEGLPLGTEDGCRSSVEQEGLPLHGGDHAAGETLHIGGVGVEREGIDGGLVEDDLRTHDVGVDLGAGHGHEGRALGEVEGHVEGVPVHVVDEPSGLQEYEVGSGDVHHADAALAVLGFVEEAVRTALSDQ